MKIEMKIKIVALGLLLIFGMVNMYLAFEINKKLEALRIPKAVFEEEMKYRL
jgi:hypothetical protein